MSAKPIKLIVINNPVGVRDRQIRSVPYHCQRLQTLCKKYAPHLDNPVVHVNQIRLTNEERRTTRLHPGDEVIIVPAIRDIVGGTIALLTWATGTATIGGALMSIAWTVGVAIGMSYLIRALGPKPEESDFGGTSQSFMWNPVTKQQQGLVIPRAYGENKFYGNIVSSWVNPVGKSETMYLTLGLNEGPVEGIVADSIRIQDQPVGNFDGVATYERKGTFIQTAIFSSEKLEYRPNRMVKKSVGAETWTTPDNDFDKLEIALMYSGFYYHKSGKRGGHTVNVKIEILEHGSSPPWSVLCNNYSLVCDTTPRQKNFISDQTYTGGSPVTITNGKRYDIRVTKLTLDYNESRLRNDLKLSSIREVISTAFVRPGLSLLGIEALAAGQISGGIKISCIQKCRIVNVYDVDHWVLEYSNNPAWVIWDILTQPVISGDGDGEAYDIERYDGISPSRLTPNLLKFYQFAYWCDQLVSDGEGGTEKRITFNGSFDAETNMWDAVQEVCKMSRCEVVPDGINYSIIVDKEWTEAPVQLFSAGNIKAGSFQREYLPLADRVGEIEITYIDKNRDYELVPLTYFDTGIDNPNKKISLKGMGVSRETQAWRMAYYELAKNHLIKSLSMFEADIDAIVSEKGDVINVISPWNKDGRIVSCSSNNQVIIDNERISSGDDTLIVRTHDSVTGKDAVGQYTVASISGAIITITGTWSVTPSPGDVYALGPTDKVVGEYRVIGIDESEELTHKLVVTEYHDGIYSGDDGEPVIPISGYMTPQSDPLPAHTRPIPLNELYRMYPDELLRELSIDIPLTTNVKWEDDTPSANYVRWSAEDAETPLLLDYRGTINEITASNTDKKYIYWDEANPTVFSVTDTVATAIAAGRWLMAYNDLGTAGLAFGRKIIHGGLIQADTITAQQVHVINDSQISIGIAFDSYTKLLLHLDGADEAVATTDSSTSAHAINFEGTAELDTAQKKFGTASLLLDGNSDYLWAANHADWDFGAGEFTIDLRVRFNALPAPAAFQTIVSQWISAGANYSFVFALSNDGGNYKLSFYYSTTGANILFVHSDVITLAVETWYHFTVVRDGNTLRFFVEGVAKGTGDLTGVTIHNSTAKLNIGTQGDGSSDFVNGWIDEVRISKGVARWTEDFTPITEAYAGTEYIYIDEWKKTGKTTIDGGEIEANSVTATQMAADSITAENAAIKDLAVDTLKIKGEAVTTEKIADNATMLQESSYIAAAENLVDETWEQVQSCSIASLGGVVEVYGGYVCHSYGGAIGEYNIRLKYAGNIVYTGEKTSPKAFGEDTNVSVNYKHSPGAGSRSYTIEAWVNYTHAGTACQAKERNMVLEESKGK